jgi:UDP-glucose 4-epimerase
VSLILITGGKGFIGRHAALHLSRRGSTIVGVGHGTWSEAKAWGVSMWLNGDIEAPNLDVVAAQAGIPDAVIHLAGGSTVGASIQSPLEDFGRTAGSTARLLEWMRTRAPQAALVGVSSAAVYGSGHERPIPETAPLRPFSPYGVHKAILEQLCQSYSTNFGMRVSILRLFSVFGAGLTKQLLWDLCCRLQSNSRVVLGGSGRETRDWIHVDDTARLIEVAITAASTDCPVFNGGTGYGRTTRDIAAAVADTWTGAANVEFSGQARQGDPSYLVADMNKSRTFLSFDPVVGVQEGIARYVQWFRSGEWAP